MTEHAVPASDTILLSGIPRSGTTLICKLLCECPNVIALNEPLPGSLFLTRTQSVEEIQTQAGNIRARLLAKGTAPVRTMDGKITDNAFDEGSGQREKVIRRTEVFFDKPLTPDFRLILNHNAEFSLLLPELALAFPFYAVVRNPIDLLASWNSVNLPVSRGKVAKADRLLPELVRRYEGKSRLLDKQLEILDWYYGQYLTLPAEHIIRYEEVIRSRGQVLQPLTLQPTIPGWELSSKNKNPLYNQLLRREYFQAITKNKGNWLYFYSTEALEAQESEQL